ncbi:MAG: hypothetical protein JO180_11700 [Gemmatirosa sp.]|nr:hypothetical protein [Gemmatirosa sp.]
MTHDDERPRQETDWSRPRSRQDARPPARQEIPRPIAPRIAAPPAGPASQPVRPRGGPPAPRRVR